MQQYLVIGGGFGVTCQDQSAAVGRWEVDVEHFDFGQFVENGPGGEAAGQGPQPRPERDVQTVGHEGDEDVGLDAVLQLMEDRP